MPERNRVTPLGDVVAIDLRGAWTGNRGIIHEGSSGSSGHHIVRSHTTTAWIVCALSYRDQVAPRWEPGRWTALFFHDEAVALAAGHRPCALCRRPAFTAYRDAVRTSLGEADLAAPQLDRHLHAERRDPATKQRRQHTEPWAGLPDGAFVVHEGQPALVLGYGLRVWTTRGYAEQQPRPRRGLAAAVTPPTSLAALRAGYSVQIGAS